MSRWSSLVLALLSACASEQRVVAPLDRPAAPDVDGALLESAPPRAESVALPTDWSSSSLEHFEHWVQSAFHGDQPTPIEKRDLATLAAALTRLDLTSMRAAIILGRSRDPAAYEVMLARLEARANGPNRPDDSGDVISAAALGTAKLVPRQIERMEPLVWGDKPHPDLEVRVEIACSVLEFGRTKAIGFLLRVLRDQTRAADDSKRDWTPTPHMAWAKSRAAFALSKFLGVSDEFKPDGSIEHQEREAARLEELWRRKQRDQAAQQGK